MNKPINVCCVLFRCLVFALMCSLFLDSVAKAQFAPISLSGGPLVKMAADFQRPYLYALQAPAASGQNGNLLFINTTNGSIVKTLPIGINPTDLTINVAEGRLYIASLGENATYVVNLTTQTLLPSFNLGTNVASINAVKVGRLIAEGQGQNTFCYDLVDTVSGTYVGPFYYPIFDGDGETDQTGTFYYHGGYGSWPPTIGKYQIADDWLGPVALISSYQTQSVNPYGTRNLVLSHNGTKIFYNGHLYDTNLNDLAWLGAEIYACSSNGAVAFSSSQAIETATSLAMYNLPVQSSVMTVDGFGQRLWYFNSATNAIESIPLAVMQKPSITLQPTNQVIYSGNTALVSVGAAGLSPLAYYWSFNGTNFTVTTNGQVAVVNFHSADTGNYSVVVSNAFGLAGSSNAALTVVDVAPAIFTQPSNLLSIAGSSAAFNVTLAGSLPMTCQWRFNGVNIDGATNAVLTLTNVQTTHEGNYSLVVTNAYGSTTSSNAFLNVVDMAKALNTSNIIWSSGGNVPWFVETNVTHDGFAAVQSGGIADGQQSTLQAVVTGPGTLTFWWSVGSEADNDCLVVSVNGVEQGRISGNLGWQQQTIYIAAGAQTLQWAYIKNESIGYWADAGWVDEVNFVQGGTAPFITLSPTNQVVVAGSNATFNAAGLGTPPLAYQWKLNSTNLDGETNASLALTNVQFANEGDYSVTISNAFGVTNTTAAFLNVVDFTEALNATNLTWSSAGHMPWYPQTATTHDGTAALRSGAIIGNQQSTVQTTVNGAATLSFWWKVSSETNNDYVSFSVDGAEQFRISGTVNWQQKTCYLTPGTHTLSWSYSKNATVNGGSDAAWLDQVSCIDGPTPAFVAVNPTDQVAALSSNATFSAVAQGTPPFRYQWLFNNNNIPDATNAALTVANVQIASAGSYAVVVTNDYGSAISSDAYLYLLNVYAWGAGRSNTLTSLNYGQSMVPTNLACVTAIAGGGYHSLALRADGRVVAWGWNNNLQTNVPSTLTNAMAVSAGLYHSLALRSNGTVTAWGYSGYGLNTTPASATNVMAIAAGWYHNLTLRSNGTVVAWGAGTSQGSFPNCGQSMVPTNLSGVAAVAAGAYHSLALRTNGTVVAWGLNASGQTNVPAGLSNVMAIAAGASNSIALKEDGTLLVWGDNKFGQTNVPPDLTNVVAVTAGAGHIAALRVDGTLRTWGLNTNGQANVPTGLTNVTMIAAGGFHNLALVNIGPPSLLNQPRGQTVYKGTPTGFRVNALGAPPLSYQWQFNGVDLPEATNSWLTFDTTDLTDSGNYQVVVSNALGTVTSATGRLTVNDTAPFFTQPPTNVNVLQNSNAVLNVSAGGLGAIGYQWLFNGSPLPDATNASLALVTIQPTSEGFYSVIASNAYGVTTSSSAFLNVIDLPESLGLTNVTWLDFPPSGWFPESTNTHDGYAAAGTGPIAYGTQKVLQTTVTGPGTLSFWWADSLNVTFSFAIDGATRATWRQYYLSSWGNPTFYLSAGSHVLTWTAENTYSSYAQGSAILDQVTYIPGPTAPGFSSQPASQTNAAGANVTLTTGPIGTPPLYCQWFFNGAILPGATGSSLTLNNIQAANTGVYYLVASNSYGVAVSSNANLTVLPAAPAFSTQPVGGSVLLGNTVILGGAATGTTPIDYQWCLNGVAITGATNTSLTISNVGYADGGNYSLFASNTVGFASSSNALVSPYSLAELAATLDNPDITWSTTNVLWFPQTNVTHDGISAAQSGLISGSQQSTLQGVASGPATVTYWWKVNCDDFWVNLSFNLNGTVQNAIAGTVDWQKATNYIGAGTQVMQWNLYPVHGSFSGGTGWVDQVEITAGGTAPILMSNPANVTTAAGNNTSFSVSTVGTPPLQYQWLFNGNAIASATNSTLPLNNVQSTNAGLYSAIVSNAFGWITSTNASLTVNTSAPVITLQPPSQSRVFYSTTSFSVRAKGSEPLDYQWLFNGLPLAGANDSTLTLTNLQSTDAGDYSAVIHNAYGSVTSVVAQLEVASRVVVDCWPMMGIPPSGYYSAPFGLSNVVALAAGCRHTAALRRDGTVVCWGGSSLLTNVPASATNVMAIAAGTYHVVALRTNGTVIAWGDTAYGQTTVPDSATNIVAIAAAANSTLALRNDGTVVGWGENNHGQLNAPAELNNVRSISLGPDNGFAIKNDGTLVQWGNGPVWSQNGVSTNLSVAVGKDNISDVTAGGFSAWTLHDDSSLFGWGWPSGLHGDNGVVTIAASGDGSSPFNDYLLALHQDGTLNPYSYLPYAPRVPLTQTNIIAIAAGFSHAAIIINDGTPWSASPIFSQTRIAGATVAFSAGIVGPQPMAYQWQFNGTDIVGATNGVLVITNVPLSASGDYSCYASNVRGCVTNGPATLTVLRSTPQFLPSACGIDGGGAFHFSVSGLSGHGEIILYASTNLLDWEPLSTNPPTVGTLIFTDSQATNSPQRFYRIQEK